MRTAKAAFIGAVLLNGCNEQHRPFEGYCDVSIGPACITSPDNFTVTKQVGSELTVYSIVNADETWSAWVMIGAASMAGNINEAICRDNGQNPEGSFGVYKLVEYDPLFADDDNCSGSFLLVADEPEKPHLLIKWQTSGNTYGRF